MIVVLKPRIGRKAEMEVIEEVRKLGYKPHVIRGVIQTVIACIGDERTHPPIAGGDSALAARLWLEASLARPVRRQVLLGEARTLQKDLTQARNALAAEVEVVAPPSRVEMPVRPRALPYQGGVVRSS